VLGIIIGSLYSCLFSFLCELFPQEIRYTAVSLGYNLGLSIFAGNTPLILTYIFKTTQNLIVPSLYLIILNIACIISLKKLTYKHSN
jgi:MHS family proline/betaine transporter-like MFS transporter